MSSLRRLAKEHATLRKSPPPNYVFPQSDDSDSLPDDLSQLSIYLTGSEGTPYSAGLWLLHLRIPHDYPKTPPKATFKTRIFHPNIEETSGAVCLETLKRDWDPKLTLKDVLITISCLLIQPNPDSALNEKAGVLVREDYEGFVRQARLMTRIHAPVPQTLREEVDEAKRRGEETDNAQTQLQRPAEPIPIVSSKDVTVESSGDESADSTKENNPQRADMAVQDKVHSTRKPVLGKRPLVENEENAPLSVGQLSSHQMQEERPRKSPKHSFTSQANGSVTATTDEDTLFPKSGVQDGVLTAILSQNLQQNNHKPNAFTKYRTYARIGIKRL